MHPLKQNLFLSKIQTQDNTYVPTFWNVRIV